ncbi:MAG: hypothetical protein JWR26_2665 [Pedosphaera sp.]|nr:hypothetical protein [Pedosphaera sp.]
MAYFLAKERDGDVLGSFKAYQEYLKRNQNQFPPGAFMLGTALCYYNANDHRCPHDGRLQTVLITEEDESLETDRRLITMRIKLLGRYGDGHIELFYPEVFRFEFLESPPSNGMGDWRYDEFTVTSQGRVIHEIEWRETEENKEPRWVIEASDVLYSWIPEKPGVAGAGKSFLSS